MTSKSSISNCWEFWDCELEARKECPARICDMGKECWLVAGHYAEDNKKCPNLKKEFESCEECPWYNKLNNKVE